MSLDALFDLPGAPRADSGPSGPKWGGRAVMKLRAELEATLPVACWRGCGTVIRPGDVWHVGHITDRSAGGEADARMVTASDVAVECPACNLSAGGKLGAARTNGARTLATQAHRERTVRWW